MTRSSFDRLHELDSEIEITLRRLRKAMNIVVSNSSNFVSSSLYPQLEPTQSYELKYGLMNLLPKFHGLVGEDPHKHLKEFHVVCSIMRP
ncbi:hypothetical protein CR513_52339, partial [Mucuna pruriens]